MEVAENRYHAFQQFNIPLATSLSGMSAQGLDRSHPTSPTFTMEDYNRVCGNDESRAGRMHSTCTQWKLYYAEG